MTAPTTSAGRPGADGTGHVLLLHQASDLYGSDRMLIQIALALHEAGAAPIVVLPEGGLLPGVLAGLGIEAHEVPAARLLKVRRSASGMAALVRLALAIPSALSTLDAVVGIRRIRLVYSNTLAILAGAVWAARRRLPHVWHLHEIVDRPKLAAWVLKAVARALAVRWVCNSQATQRWFAAGRPRLLAASPVVLNAAVDQSGGERSVWGPHFRPCGERWVVGVVGRIVPGKGHAVALQALEMLAQRGCQDVALVFIGGPAPGGGQHLQALTQRVARSPVARHVRFVGELADTRSAYAEMDIVCVPSLVPESFGLVAAEAMSAQRPVLAARSGGLPEVVQDGITGLLHRPGDALGLADGLQRLMQQPGLAARMGHAGRQAYLRQFTPVAMRRSLVQALGSPAWTPA
ncbi:MAG: glycosyltransferase family 4 protein [Aquabacterium sp.]